jgi:hypothetical protein
MMVNLKILITSAPRSGHAWLAYYLRHTLYQSKLIDKENSLIERNNYPLMLDGIFNNAVQTTILRKPDQIIPSNGTKFLGGLGINYSQGLVMPVELDQSGVTVSGVVDEQIKQYLRWLEGLNNNLNNIIPFTFEQITETPEIVCNFFIKYFNLNDVDINDFNFNDLFNRAHIDIFQHIKVDKNYSNAMPVNEKPEIYYKIQKEMVRHNKYHFVLTKYEETLNNIKNRQIGLGYN